MTDIGEAPAQIRELAKSLAGLEPDAVRNAIIQSLGPATRDVGSGIRIEQWDVDGGVLVFHPGRGPTYRPKGGKEVRLLRTTNELVPNIRGSFEMTTLLNQYGTRFWVGNVTLYSDDSYAYVDGDSNPEGNVVRANNFFALHPKGRFEVKFQNGFSPTTRLETIPDATQICTLTFSPDDGSSPRTFSIRSNFFDRRLEFTDDEPLDFELDKGWENFWK